MPADSIITPAAIARFALTTAIGFSLDLWTKAMAVAHLKNVEPFKTVDEMTERAYREEMDDFGKVRVSSADDLRRPHVGRFQAAHRREQCAGHMKRAADSGRGIIQRAGMGFAVIDQLLDRYTLIG